MLAWHFLPDDGRLQFGRRSAVRVGQTLRRDPSRLEMCHYGLHASVRPLDALYYAPGPIICRVRLGGTIIEYNDKCVASRRTVLWMQNIEKELRLFACWCVRNTPLGDGRVVWDLLTDKRSRNAVKVAEQYAIGEAAADDLRAAWVKAGIAAWGAAREAAREVAWEAARRAAWEAAWEATWGAAREVQNKELERVLLEIEAQQ